MLCLQCQGYPRFCSWGRPPLAFSCSTLLNKLNFPLCQVVLMNFDSLSTCSSKQQHELEQKVAPLIARGSELQQQVRLEAAHHVRYLEGGLKHLPGAFVSLESSRPWILYWVVHSLALLKANLPGDVGITGQSQ